QAAQKAIGTPCNSDNSNIDWDTIGQCNGATFQKGPLMLGAVATPTYATTTCDAAKAGMLQWTGTSFKSCNGSSWTAFGEGSFLGPSATNTAPARPGDITTGLFSDTASTVSIATAGVSRMTVTASGSVGIGTTVPGYKLDVVGTIQANGGLLSTASGADIGGYITISNTAKAAGTALRWNIYNMSGSYGNSLQFWAYDNGGCGGSGLCSSRFVLMDNGNVGIGTQPSTLLEISKPSGGAADLAINRAGNTSDYARVIFKTGGVSKWYLGLDKDLFPNSDKFMVYGPSGLSTTFDVNGNVGIGTANPALRLHVVGNNNFVRFENTDTTANTYTQIGLVAGSAASYLWTANQNSTSWGGANSLNIYAGSGGAMTFWTNATERMRIDASGNLTFGLANPYLTASSYMVIPGGAYFNSGTVYTEATIQARGGIHNDNGANLNIYGGTSGHTAFSGTVSASAPTASNHLATKAYVDSVAGGGAPTMISALAYANTIIAAVSYCRTLSAACQYTAEGAACGSTTYSDWRLPSAEEMMLFVGLYSDNQYLWTRTPVLQSGSANNPGFFVSFYNGAQWVNTMSYAYNDTAYVRCVR
ncbi:MAG: hypothetical protein PHX43_08675, partial [Alphaproteobacteria bacterium]|nr:hypothetical protein [Alphaproteobacteria bacterium]